MVTYGEPAWCCRGIAWGRADNGGDSQGREAGFQGLLGVEVQGPELVGVARGIPLSETNGGDYVQVIEEGKVDVERIAQNGDFVVG